jgi:hypothetical protein
MYLPFPQAERLEPSLEEQEMFKWAADRGVTWPKIVYPVKFPPGYIGSMAIEEILPGERIVTASNRALFTTNVALNSDLKPIFEQCPENFTKSMLSLVTYLIWEKSKGPASSWAPFIKYQPNTPSNLQDWEEEELNELQDINLINDVSNK